MADFVTLSELRSFAAKLNERELLYRARTSKAGKTVFLAHSSIDEPYLPGVISVLQNHGGNVYIDKADQRLPDRPTRETAEILRDTIKLCLRFVVFVTKNSKESRWVPWELGLADGEKGSNPIALFPAAQNSYDQSWSEQEFLGLYRRIVWGKIKNWNSGKPGWIVRDHTKNTADSLSNWLRGY